MTVSKRIKKLQKHLKVRKIQCCVGMRKILSEEKFRDLNYMGYLVRIILIFSQKLKSLKPYNNFYLKTLNENWNLF